MDKIPEFKIEIADDDDTGIERISLVDLEKYHGYPFVFFSSNEEEE